MKRYCRNFITKSFLIIFLAILPCVLKAGEGFNSPPSSINDGLPPSDGLGDSPDAPIDGGITLLLAAGIGYGVKKHRENKKKKTVDLE